jgi:hypothetical protein
LSSLRETRPIRARDPQLLIRTCVFAAAVPLLFRLKLSTLEALLERRLRRIEPSTAKSRHIAAYVDRALRMPFVRAVCLTRGLTLYYFLRRSGEEVDLCFGVREIEGAFRGHCWLEKEGVPYLEHTDPRETFRPIHTMSGRCTYGRP